MNIRNFTKRDLEAYENYKAFTEGRLGLSRKFEEVVGALALAAFALICMMI